MFRRALHVSELTDEEMAALGTVEIPAEADRYNHEVLVAESIDGTELILHNLQKSVRDS